MQIQPVALAVIRTLAGLSQAKLSEKSGVSQGYISGIESGDKKASPEMIKKLADALGVPIASLITDPTPGQVEDAMLKLGKKVPLTKALSAADDGLRAS
jgi:transcriptional regulator with XRE-family HTH domain